MFSKPKGSEKVTHEEKMQKAWRFIAEAGITEKEEDYKEDNDLYLVENIYQVRDAYYDDLEKGISIEEDVCEFLDRHGIGWK